MVTLNYSDMRPMEFATARAARHVLADLVLKDELDDMPMQRWTLVADDGYMLDSSEYDVSEDDACEPTHWQRMLAAL